VRQRRESSPDVMLGLAMLVLAGALGVVIGLGVCALLL
jgi:hypothetical protein